MDLLIASHAFSAGAILVSHDKAFDQISSLLTVADGLPTSRKHPL